MILSSKSVRWDKIHASDDVKNYLSNALDDGRGLEALISSWISRADYWIVNSALRSNLPKTREAIDAYVNRITHLIPTLDGKLEDHVAFIRSELHGDEAANAEMRARNSWNDETSRKIYAIWLASAHPKVAGTIEGKSKLSVESSLDRPLWRNALDEFGFSPYCAPSSDAPTYFSVFAGLASVGEYLMHFNPALIITSACASIAVGTVATNNYVKEYKVNTNFMQEDIVKAVLAYSSEEDVRRILEDSNVAEIDDVGQLPPRTPDYSLRGNANRVDAPESNVTDEPNFVLEDEPAHTTSFTDFKEPESASAASRIESVREVIDRLNEEWLEYEIDPEAYYLSKPLLRDLNVASTKKFRETEAELNDLFNELNARSSEDELTAAENAAEQALMAWGDANDNALAVGISDRSPTERAALRRLSALTAQFNDPSTPREMWDALSKRIIYEMDKLTTVKVSTAHRRMVELQIDKRLSIGAAPTITVDSLLQSSAQRCVEPLS